MDYQSIKLDDLHNHASAVEGEQKFNFTIRPGSFLTIDATNYDFKIPEQVKDKKIELIQVIIDNNTYQANLSGDSLIHLSKSNLQLIKGDKEFAGFEENSTVIIGIGFNYEPIEKGAISLGVIYAAIVDVKK
ncbi:MAG: hypothetical protein JXB49_20265 [Bacteroidales bacterium]|nr:hypothetical protein [Bacteroidales bacterium]